MIVMFLVLQVMVIEVLLVDVSNVVIQIFVQVIIGGGINYFELMVKVSLLVKIIVLLLLVGLFVSWVIIFCKVCVFKQVICEVDEFENCFWFGVDLGKLYSVVIDCSCSVIGLEVIFEVGFCEYICLCDKCCLDGCVQLEGVQCVMCIIYICEVDQFECNLELLVNIGLIVLYVGLVGIVFGIMVIMYDMISSGVQVGIVVVVLGIFEVLFVIVIGLFVVILVVWVYNCFIICVECMLVWFEIFVEEFSFILQCQSVGDE